MNYLENFYAKAFEWLLVFGPGIVIAAFALIFSKLKLQEMLTATKAHLT